VSKN